MPHRNSTTGDQTDSTLTLRRSPRLLTRDRPPEDYQKTPDSQSEKTTKMPHRNSTTRDQPDSTLTLRRSPRLLTRDRPPDDYPKTPDSQSEKTHMRHPKVSKTVEELKSGSNFSGESETGSRRSATLYGDVFLRRSPRFSGNKSATTDECDDKKSSSKLNRKGSSKVGKAEGGINQSKQIGATTEKRVTHRSSRGTANECAKRITKEELTVAESANVSANPSMHSGNKLQKMTKRSSASKNGKGNVVISSVSNGIFNEDDFLNVERAKEGASSCKKYGSKLEKRTTCTCGTSSVLIGGEGKKKGDLDRGIKEIGVKRKRNQVDEGRGTDKGWTKDQETALQRAYFAAKPTPHFWKKVAKLVPGKSEKECFNKLYSDHLTPPQPRTRLRSRKTNSLPFSLSTSKLLKPDEQNTRRPSRCKQSRRLAQKTVRQLLQKHYNVDQNFEADLFSVLESTTNSTSQALQQGLTNSTPEGVQKYSGYLKKCCERSSSTCNKKHISRLGGLDGTTLMSPLVLKQIKNKALHEKYIDQLHSRDAKRRAAKVIMGKENRKESDNNTPKMNAIKAAKDALVFDAKDVIHQFHHVKVSGMGDFPPFDDDFGESDDYEVESES